MSEINTLHTKLQKCKNDPNPNSEHHWRPSACRLPPAARRPPPEFWLLDSTGRAPKAHGL